MQKEKVGWRKKNNGDLEQKENSWFEKVNSRPEDFVTKYKIGVIANQSLGTADRLEQKGILKYIELVIASAEEGVSKPDRRIFEIALYRAQCKPENEDERADQEVDSLSELLGLLMNEVK